MVLGLWCVPARSQKISLTKSKNSVYDVPKPPAAPRLSSFIMREGGVDWSGVVFERDCGAGIDCKKDLNISVVTVPMPLKCFTQSPACKATDYGLGRTIGSDTILCDNDGKVIVDVSLGINVQTASFSANLAQFEGYYKVPEDGY